MTTSLTKSLRRNGFIFGDNDSIPQIVSAFVKVRNYNWPLDFGLLMKNLNILVRDMAGEVLYAFQHLENVTKRKALCWLVFHKQTEDWMAVFEASTLLKTWSNTTRHAEYSTH